MHQNRVFLSEQETQNFPAVIDIALYNSRHFLTSVLARKTSGPLLPLKRAMAEVDKRFVAYLLELTDDVTGRIVDVLRRAALQGLADRSKKVGLDQLQYTGARMPGWAYFSCQEYRL
jgi:hypothetical protein